MSGCLGLGFWWSWKNNVNGGKNTLLGWWKCFKIDSGDACTILNILRAIELCTLNRTLFVSFLLYVKNFPWQYFLKVDVPGDRVEDELTPSCLTHYINFNNSMSLRSWVSETHHVKRQKQTNRYLTNNQCGRWNWQWSIWFQGLRNHVGCNKHTYPISKYLGLLKHEIILFFFKFMSGFFFFQMILTY